MFKRGTSSGMNEAGGGGGGGGGGGNNRNFLNAQPIKGLLGGIKGKMNPLDYAKELFTAIKDGKTEEFKDLHARFPHVMAKLNSQANSQEKNRLRHALELGHEALLDLRKVYLAESRDQTFPSDPAASKQMRDSYDERFRAIWKVLEDRALSDLVDAAGTAVSMQVDKAYMKLMRQKGQQESAQLAAKIKRNAIARVAGPLAPTPVFAFAPTSGAPPPGTGGGGGGGGGGSAIGPLPVPLFPPPPRQPPAVVPPAAPYVPPTVWQGPSVPGSAFPPRPPTGGYKRKGRKGSRTRRNKRSRRAKTRRS